LRLQLLSDLHLETEVYAPEPAPDAELLVLAGDIDSTWAALEKFRGWPVPVLMIAGNHEFDERELTQAWPALRERCARLAITLLECERLVLTDREGQRIRFVGTTRWSDFDLFGAQQRERAMRAAGYFVKIMRATRHGAVLDAVGVREESLACRAWLEAARIQSSNALCTIAVRVPSPPATIRVSSGWSARASAAMAARDEDVTRPGSIAMTRMS